MLMRPAEEITLYVEERDGAYWVAGSRVSLDSVVYAFWSGQTPESIAQSFPTLSLEQVYGTAAYYLAHQVEIDRYLAGRRADFEKLRQEARQLDPAFHQKLAEAKRGVSGQS